MVLRMQGVTDLLQFLLFATFDNPKHFHAFRQRSTEMH